MLPRKINFYKEPNICNFIVEINCAFLLVSELSNLYHKCQPFADVHMYLPAKIVEASRPSFNLLDSPPPPQEDQVNLYIRFFYQLFEKCYPNGK